MQPEINNDIILSSHPIDIYEGLNIFFKDEPWLTWEPETLLLELKNDITDAAVDKLLAVQAVCSNANAVTRSAAAFEKTVNAFNNNICIMDVIQPPYIEEIVYAVDQIEKLIKAVHGTDTKVIYTDEVPSYVAGVGKFRGWFMLPKNLQFAQDMLNTISHRDPESALYEEHKEIIDSVSDFVKNTDKRDAEQLLNELKHLQHDDVSTFIVKKIVGALLYDPTILTKNNW